LLRQPFFISQQAGSLAKEEFGYIYKGVSNVNSDPVNSTNGRNGSEEK
jgi:hypothetical protein